MAARGDGWKRRLLPNDEYMRLPCLFKPLGPKHHSKGQVDQMSGVEKELIRNTTNLRSNVDAFF